MFETLIQKYALTGPSSPNDRILLFSGGLDSTVLLWLLKPRVKCLLFDYGQRHNRELYTAQSICYEEKIPYRVVNLSSGIPHDLLQSGCQLNPSEPVPEGRFDDEIMKATVSPNRNMIMLSIAIGWAVTTESERVFYAPHGGDHAIYPDCRPEFVKVMNRAAQLQGWWPVKVEAPFTGLTKTDLVKLGAELGVPFEVTYSCYKGGLNHCGKCGTCQERREAFIQAGVTDPTIYES